MRSITWPLLADGYAVTWAPAPAGCSLTLDRHGPEGENAAYRGAGPTTRASASSTSTGTAESTLSMLLDEGGRVRLITPAPEAGTGEAGKEPGR